MRSTVASSTVSAIGHVDSRTTLEHVLQLVWFFVRVLPLCTHQDIGYERMPSPTLPIAHQKMLYVIDLNNFVRYGPKERKRIVQIIFVFFACGEIIQYNVHSRISTDCFIRSHSPSKYTQHIPIYNRFMNKVRLAHTLTGLLSVVNYPQIHLAIRQHVST